MINLANSIHTNIDQSATLVQPKEKISTVEQPALQSSKGFHKERQSSDHSSGNDSSFSGKSRKDVEFKKTSSEVVHLYSNPSQAKGEASQAKKDEVSHVNGEGNHREAIQESDELKVVSELKARDAEVRQHELAHAAVGGTHTGAPQYKFVKGPDGKNYAVEGEVSVDISFSGGAEEKLEKARTVRAAALAPAEPSSQDRQVAAQAARVAMQAQTELVKLKAQEKSENSSLEDDKSSSDKRLDNASLDDKPVLGDPKILGGDNQSERSLKKAQPIFGSDKGNKLDKEIIGNDKAEGLLNTELKDAEKVSKEEKQERDKADTSASLEMREARSSSVSKAEKSPANQDATDEVEASEGQEASQSVSSSGSGIDEVSIFFENQSKMLASYDQIVRSGEYINENNGGFFKYAELNVLA